jgi:hypothetical protein
MSATDIRKIASLAGRTRRVVAWAGVGAALCGVACAASLVGAGALCALAGTTRIVVFGALAAGAVVIALVARLRGRTRRAATAGMCGPRGCAADAAAGCKPYASPQAQPDEAIVCTANLWDTSNIMAQVDGYRAAFRHLIGTERFPGGFRWTFRARPGLYSELVRLAQREHQCCRFFHFEVKEVTDAIVWETTADDRASPVLDEYSHLPERLRAEPRPGHDLLALKGAAQRAGLRFAGDEEVPRE